MTAIPTQEDPLSVVVWWTIPDSHVAWEWLPSESIFIEGALFRERDGCCYVVPASAKAHRWRASQQPCGQPLAEMTAHFAMEANIRPTGTAITWLRGDTAVRWERPTDRWLRHGVGTRQGLRCLYDETELLGIPTPGSVEDAAATALGLVGSEQPGGGVG